LPAGDAKGPAGNPSLVPTHLLSYNKASQANAKNQRIVPIEQIFLDKNLNSCHATAVSCANDLKLWLGRNWS
jgi:hypothetical protein